MNSTFCSVLQPPFLPLDHFIASWWAAASTACSPKCQISLRATAEAHENVEPWGGMKKLLRHRSAAPILLLLCWIQPLVCDLEIHDQIYSKKVPQHSAFIHINIQPFPLNLVTNKQGVLLLLRHP